MKKILSLTLAAVMAIALTACSSSSNTETTKATQGTSDSVTLKKDVLQIGVEIGYPPMEYVDEDGTTAIGFDIEVANALAKKMGMKAEFVDTAWDGIFAGVKTDKYDCIISSVSITDTRKTEFNMTTPYVGNRLVLVTSKDSKIKSLEDLDGHSVCVQAETSADDYIKKYMEDNSEKVIDYYPYDKVLNCFDDLKTGRVETVLVDSVVASYYLGEDADQYQTVWENEDLEPIGICIKKGNDTLTAEIEKAISALFEDGTMKKLSEKYFGSDICTGVRE